MKQKVWGHWAQY